MSKNNIIALLIVALVAMGVLVYWYDTRISDLEELRTQDAIAMASVRDTLHFKDNVIAKSGISIKNLKMQNEALERTVRALQVKADYYIGLYTKVVSQGSSGLKKDTIYVYADSTGDSTAVEVKKYSLLSDDSTIYVAGTVYPDSIVADTMQATIPLQVVAGVDKKGEVWVIAKSDKPSIQVVPQYVIKQSITNKWYWSAGIYFNQTGGVILSTRHNSWLVGLGVDMNKSPMIMIQKEFKLPWQ